MAESKIDIVNPVGNENSNVTEYYIDVHNITDEFCKQVWGQCEGQTWRLDGTVGWLRGEGVKAVDADWASRRNPPGEGQWVRNFKLKDRAEFFCLSRGGETRLQASRRMLVGESLVTEVGVRQAGRTHTAPGPQQSLLAAARHWFTN